MRNRYSWPYNLIHDLRFEESLTADQIAGLEYAVSLLSPRARLVIDKRYRQKMLHREIAAELGVSTSYIGALLRLEVARLRQPAYVVYIFYGLNGKRQRDAAALAKAEDRKKQLVELYGSTPIDAIGLSDRTRNSILRHFRDQGTPTVKDIVMLSDEEIMAIRGLGVKQFADLKRTLDNL